MNTSLLPVFFHYGFKYLIEFIPILAFIKSGKRIPTLQHRLIPGKDSKNLREVILRIHLAELYQVMASGEIVAVVWYGVEIGYSGLYIHQCGPHCL